MCLGTRKREYEGNCLMAFQVFGPAPRHDRCDYTLMNDDPEYKVRYSTVSRSFFSELEIDIELLYPDPRRIILRSRNTRGKEREREWEGGSSRRGCYQANLIPFIIGMLGDY